MNYLLFLDTGVLDPSQGLQVVCVRVEDASLHPGDEFRGREVIATYLEKKFVWVSRLNVNCPQRKAFNSMVACCGDDERPACRRTDCETMNNGKPCEHLAHKEATK